MIFANIAPPNGAAADDDTTGGVSATSLSPKEIKDNFDFSQFSKMMESNEFKNMMKKDEMSKIFEENGVGKVLNNLDLGKVMDFTNISNVLDKLNLTDLMDKINISALTEGLKHTEKKTNTEKADENDGRELVRKATVTTKKEAVTDDKASTLNNIAKAVVHSDVAKAVGAAALNKAIDTATVATAKVPEYLVQNFNDLLAKVRNGAGTTTLINKENAESFIHEFLNLMAESTKKKE